MRAFRPLGAFYGRREKGNKSFVVGKRTDRLGLQRQCVFARRRLGLIGKWRENRLALFPIGKLIGIVRASELTRLTSRNQQNGLIPVRGIGDEAHRRPMRFGGGAYAVHRSRLRLAGDAEECSEQPFLPDRVLHFERIEIFPGPIFSSSALRELLKL